MPPSTKTIHIHYFAQLRERRGLERETIHTSAPTPAQLFKELKEKHGFPLEQSHLKVAINNQFGNWNEPLHSGDDVAFIPPVAGG